MNEPEFLLMTDDDRAGWRGIGGTQAFLKYLDWEAAGIEDAILAMVRAGRGNEAQVLSGKLEAVREIKAICWRRMPVAEVAEEPFVDPAAIWSKP